MYQGSSAEVEALRVGVAPRQLGRPLGKPGSAEPRRRGCPGRASRPSTGRAAPRSASGSPRVAISQSSTAARDRVARGDEHVVQPVVAVHDRGRAARPARRRQPAAQLVDAGQVAAAGARPAACPAAHLAGEVALGAAEVGQPDRGGSTRCSAARVSTKRMPEAPAALGAERGGLRGGAETSPSTQLHQVERRAEHVGVGAQQQRARHRHGGRCQRADHPVLAGHVVGGRQHVPQRRPAQHPPARRRRSAGR